MWFKKRFIVPLRAGCETTTRFIQATVKDNAFVNKENRAILDGLTGWKLRAWRDGDWDLAAGQYFTNFSRDAVAVPFEAQAHWEYWLGIDYGYQHYTVCYLLARDGDGNVYIVAEHAERNWVPEEHATAIIAMVERYPVARLEAILGGHDFFNRDQHGKSIAQDYADFGLHIERADIDRVNGAAEILRRLGNPDAQPPRPPTLFIHPRCARLLDCIPELQRDDKRPEDVLKQDINEDGEGGDDYYDAARYGIMYAAVDRRVRTVRNQFADVR